MQEKSLKPGGSAALSPAQAHYLKNVLRKQPGDSLRLFNGESGEYLARIETLSKKDGRAALTKQIKEQTAPAFKTRLLFAPIKKARIDILIEKAVELGATDLHPILTQRTENRKLNEQRLRAQIIEAAEQCERLTIPALHPLQKLESVLSNWNETPLYAALERAHAPTLSQTLKPGDKAFLIGPEGGFAPEEITIIEKSNAAPVSLGENILRAETAALLCLSLSPNK